MKISAASKILPCFLLMVMFSCSSNNGKQEQALASADQKSEPAFTVSNGDTTWIRVDKMPVYSGGDKALLNHIIRNIVYPEEAKKAGTQGQVVARFRVGTDGRISMVSVLKGVDPLLDAETIRVIKTISFEEPGYIQNKPVPVWYVLPVLYSLN